MQQMLSAVYEHGSLRLLEPLELSESSQVNVQILPPKPDFQVLAFNRQIDTVRQLLTSVEAAWDDDFVREFFPPILRADLHTLWQVSREPQRTLCALLQLSAAHIQSDQVTQEQIAAIHFVLDQLSQSSATSLTEDNIQACHLRLIASGLQSAFSLNDEAVQSYIDEL